MTTPAEALAHGWQLHQKKDYPAAEQIYRQVLQQVPNEPNAWCYLGMACHDQDRFEEAVSAYRRAIQIQPQFPVAFNNLGNSLRLLRRLPEAVASFDQALCLKPDYANAHKNKGTAYVWEGHLEEGLACYRQALELDADDAESHKNIGVIQLLKGQFEEGWREYRWRWKTENNSLPPYEGPLWDGESLAGKTVLLAVEQGLGDTIHFIRYAQVLKQKYDCRIIAAVQPVLLPLLNSCQDIDVLISKEDKLPEYDIFVPLLDIPGILGDDLSCFPTDIPYVSADPELLEHWQQELAAFSDFKIGIAWQGNPDHQADRFRSVPLHAMAPLGRLNGIQLFSLQKGHGVQQLHDLAGRLDPIHLGDQLDEEAGAFMDTAAVLKNLDLLITSDTAIAHVAGALGVPTWVALAYVPDWRWLQERNDSPWYASMRLFRQSKIGDWDSVFQQMAIQLEQQSTTITWKQPRDFRLGSCGMNRLTSTRHGLMLYNRHDKYIGHSLDAYGEFSEGECEMFRQLIRTGSVVVEAGSNVGAHTLLLSELAGDTGAVFAFEPQRILFQTLCANLALNSRTNAHCRCEAVGEATGEILVPTLDYTKENNFGGLGLGSYQSGEKVPVVSIDSLNLPRCDFLKADVEGMELGVLKGAAETISKCKPLLYVENDRAETSAALIEYVLSLGYKLYWHLPPMFNPGNYFGNRQNEFGSIVSVNMLGVHESVKSSIEGLRPVEGPNSDWRTS